MALRHWRTLLICLAVPFAERIVVQGALHVADSLRGVADRILEPLPGLLKFGVPG